MRSQSLGSAGHENESRRERKRKYEQIDALRTLREIPGEEVEEGLHFGIEGLAILGSKRVRDGQMRTHLLRSGVLDRADETTNLVAHGLGGDAGSGGLEVDVTAAANAGIERVGAGS